MRKSKDKKKLDFENRGVDKITQIGTVWGNVTVQSIQSPECYICGQVGLPDEFYKCQRCQKIVCLKHQKETKAPICPNCLELIKIDCEDMLFDQDEEKRVDAAKLLCAIKDSSMLKTVEHCLEIEESEYVRHWLAYAIGQTGGEEAYEILKKAESGEKNHFALQGIQAALAEIAAAKLTKP